MFAAALVTGNTVLLKPAEQSTLVAYRMFQLFLEAGMPPSAACFLPGLGEEVGPILVNHPLVTTIAFTGSRDVGMQIVTQAAEVSNRSQHVKRVIAEMGGKNAIIIDDDADLDEAVKGVVSSAFGYQGQKCSACSRVIVLESAYERFLERLAEATKSIITGPASDPSTLIGPVIDQEAFERISRAIEAAKMRCRLVAKGPQPSSTVCRSPLIAPIVFADIPEEDALLRQEIFGPVLAVLRAKDFDDALRIALDSDYALTGAVFSRSPEHIEKAMRDFRVGNLYINRGCTGALVHRQPFGGARMSGVGSKAGGPDYLLQFVIPRAISENTIRRGFAPESR
jgi:RHH-type proline utilization regulon transcriptional repressor/proline dehydrogenase/delta 1-pyrroline-5-carboxylate dehydrogenase